MEKNPDRLKPISLHPMSLEDALKKALEAPAPPKEPHKPGAGRKKKPKA